MKLTVRHKFELERALVQAATEVKTIKLTSMKRFIKTIDMDPAERALYDLANPEEPEKENDNG